MKARVQNLKREQQRALGHQKAAHMAETAALLEQRMAYESKLAQMEANITSLTQQIKQTNERSAKLRTHCERTTTMNKPPGLQTQPDEACKPVFPSQEHMDKKALQVQLDQANKTLQSIDAEHAQE
eukprot:scaffold80381_cov18-Tisochrysis_lutea.AAC.1